jgi:hypothetical protein
MCNYHTNYEKQSSYKQKNIKIIFNKSNVLKVFSIIIRTLNQPECVFLVQQNSVYIQSEAFAAIN